MAPRRLFVAGFSHHVRHRGNNRSPVFADDSDRHKFLELIERSARKHEVSVHGYVLMRNHYHAIVTGRGESSLPRMMQSLGKDYVRYFNKRHRRTGTLWEGRYRASLIATPEYWLTCLRYVEMNPVAARMVRSPDEYAWSSYGAHALGKPDVLLTTHPLLLELGTDAASRAAAWTALCGQPIDDPALAELRSSTRDGAPIGLSASAYEDLLRSSREHGDRWRGQAAAASL